MVDRPAAPLAEQLAILPRSPGVYMMLDKRGGVLYVGKAKSLSNRVRSYFQRGAAHAPRIRAMVEQVLRVEVILTDTEAEALILENTLIKRHWPEFNVKLKDGREYPFLKITWQEPFPRLLIARRRQADGARYYGPYPNSGAVYSLIEAAERIFQIKHCHRKPGDRPCLDYFMHRCLAPCLGKVAAEEYRALVGNVTLFLEGKSDELLKRLWEAMWAASDREDFERAERFKHQHAAVQQLLSKQKIMAGPEVDQDVIGYARNDTWICLVLLQVRGGKLVNRLSFGYAVGQESALGEVISAFLPQYYADVDDPPREVLVPALPADREVLEEWLGQKRGCKVRVVQPQRGAKEELLVMAVRNAELALERHVIEARRDADAGAEEALQELAAALGLAAPPQRIECFDIAHVQGSDQVASMVVFSDGRPDKREYRKFKIRSVAEPNDYEAMREVLTRRYRRVVAEGAPPDLVIVDGGKGQLKVAVEVLREVGLAELPAIGLAKQHETVFLPGRKEGLLLPRRHPGLRLLQRLRDEAHRFANTFHRQIRSKRMLLSVLKGVPGVGEQRWRMLMEKFGSVERLQQLSCEELRQQSRLPQKVADAVFECLHPGAPPRNAGQEEHV